MTDNKKFTPFEIYSCDPAGLDVVVRAVSDITAESVTLLPAGTLVISEEIYKLNQDRNGDSWLDLDPEAQLARWGRQRFGLGGVPESVQATADAARHALIAAELDTLKRRNPHIARASAATLRVRELELELGI